MKKHSHLHLTNWVIGTLIGALTLLTAVQPAQAQIIPQRWQGVCVALVEQSEDGTVTGINVNPNYTPDSAEEYGASVPTIQGLQCLIANVLSIAVTLIGLGGFAMILIGAFRYLLSGGNAKAAESARSTLTFAIIGLVVALSSVIILNLISSFTGIQNLSRFVIPDSSRNMPEAS